GRCTWQRLGLLSGAWRRGVTPASCFRWSAVALSIRSSTNCCVTAAGCETWCCASLPFSSMLSDGRSPPGDVAMTRTRGLTLVALLLALGCQRTPPSIDRGADREQDAAVVPDGKSGIEGEVVVFPVDGGPDLPGRPAEAPWQDGNFTIRKGGRIVTTFSTDQDGRFRVALAPGLYTVAPTHPHVGLEIIDPW